MSGELPKIVDMNEAAPKIAEMAPFSLWTRDILGATAEDVQAHKAGTLSPERMVELTLQAEQERIRLFNMPVAGADDWMPFGWRLN